jgi:hypothetical protein
MRFEWIGKNDLKSVSASASASEPLIQARTDTHTRLQLLDRIASALELRDEAFIADQVTSANYNEVVVAFLRKMFDLR